MPLFNRIILSVLNFPHNIELRGVASSNLARFLRLKEVVSSVLTYMYHPSWSPPGRVGEFTCRKRLTEVTGPGGPTMTGPVNHNQEDNQEDNRPPSRALRRSKSPEVPRGCVLLDS